jgi:hypothetical protein
MEKIDDFTLDKQKKSKISQLFCQKIDKFYQK